MPQPASLGRRFEVARDFPFPLTRELRAVLERQRARTTQLERDRPKIIPLVFHREGQPIELSMLKDGARLLDDFNTRGQEGAAKGAAQADGGEKGK